MIALVQFNKRYGKKVVAAYFETILVPLHSLGYCLKIGYDHLVTPGPAVTKEIK
jgi:hypothetical protein